MNPFYITLIVFFASYSSQSGASKSTINIDSENLTQSRTYWPNHEIKHIWIISEFSRHEIFNTSEISSPMLHASTTDKYEWYVKIVPHNIFKGNETLSLWIYVSSDSKVEDVRAVFNASIINEKKEVLFERVSSQPVHFTAQQQGWGWGAFCKKDDFFRNHLLQNDTLTLFIRIRCVSEFSNDGPHQLEIPSSSPTTPKTTTTKSNFFENFESMLENPRFADVVFITNGSQYPAHKYILAKRSPFFAAMFRRKDSKNGNNKKIQINVTSMDEAVLRAMLRYIYTGKCEPLGNLRDRLFKAAYKYGLHGLGLKFVK